MSSSSAIPWPPPTQGQTFFGFPADQGALRHRRILLARKREAGLKIMPSRVHAHQLGAQDGVESMNAGAVTSLPVAAEIIGK